MSRHSSRTPGYAVDNRMTHDNLRELGRSHLANKNENDEKNRRKSNQRYRRKSSASQKDHDCDYCDSNEQVRGRRRGRRRSRSRSRSRSKKSARASQSQGRRAATTPRRKSRARQRRDSNSKEREYSGKSPRHKEGSICSRVLSYGTDFDDCNYEVRGSRRSERSSAASSSASRSRTHFGSMFSRLWKFLIYILTYPFKKIHKFLEKGRYGDFLAYFPVSRFGSAARRNVVKRRKKFMALFPFLLFLLILLIPGMCNCIREYLFYYVNSKIMPQSGLGCDTSSDIQSMMARMSEQRQTDESRQRVSLEEILVQQSNLEKELSLLKNQVNQQSADTNRKIGAYEESHMAHTTKLNSLSDRILSLELVLKKIESSQDSLKTQTQLDISQIRSQFSMLRADIARQLDERETKMSSMFTDLERSMGIKEGELRALFVDIVRTELLTYETKDSVNRRIADVNARLEGMSLSNKDLTSRLEMSKQYGETRLTGALSDVNSLTHKIDSWQTKLDKLRRDLELQIQTSSNANQQHGARASDVEALRTAINDLRAEVTRMRSASQTSNSGSGSGSGSGMFGSMSGAASKMCADGAVCKSDLMELKAYIEKVAANVGQAASTAGVASAFDCSGFGGSGSCLGSPTLDSLIAKAIATYNADKTGKADYALETAGGYIVSTRCSETYPILTAQVNIMGFPLWFTSNSPRTVISPDVHPGQCWCMSGSTGYIVFALSAKIRVTEISYEHSPRELAPDGSISSAPKEFSIWGLNDVDDYPGKELGKFTFQETGAPLQYFGVSSQYMQPLSMVEMRVHSNWGHKDYTCLYRVRVHGTYVSKP